MSGDCWPYVFGLTALVVALLMSLTINAIFLIRKRAAVLRIMSEVLCNRWFAQSYEGGSPLQNEGHYFADLNHRERQENPNNHWEVQENPIYGNISAERRGSVETYELMMLPNTKNHMKPAEVDINYASLDLKLAKKGKKNRRKYHGQNGGPRDSHDPTHQFTSSSLEVETDMDAHLPPRDNSTMQSHSSIYLNSQQIAQAAEENDTGADADWECENGRRRRGDYRERTSGCGGSVCSQLEVGEDVESHHF